ncbi:unnamed protein product [Brugia timori]|uniref:Uncharacterized protein n=1 Tax=Brugia timori TaxID=42155 RepID=A0A3P7X816_9BILA|nr:unnamed protein product [Brugia timori]
MIVLSSSEIMMAIESTQKLERYYNNLLLIKIYTHPR